MSEGEVQEVICTEGDNLSCDEEDGGSMFAICECGSPLLRGQYGYLSDFTASPGELRQRVVDMYEKFHIREFLFYNAFRGFSQPPPFFQQEWTSVLNGAVVNKSHLVAAVEAVRTLRGRSWFFLLAAAADKGDQELLAGQTIVDPTEVAKRLDPVFIRASLRRKLELMEREAGTSGSAALANLSGRRLEHLDPQHTVPTQDYEALCGCGPEAFLDEETRIVDVVVPTAAWALRFVPRWADFVASLKFSGVHWGNFGDLGVGQEVASDDPDAHVKHLEADIPGFLRAALPILRARNLEQTLSFVDGFGWDPVLLGGDMSGSWIGSLGRIIEFPFWEIWENPMPTEKYFKTVGSGHSFVLSCFPGYSKYHCCSRHEEQNRGNFGIKPEDIGIERWKTAVKHGGSYLFIGDGGNFTHGPFLADSSRLPDSSVTKLQKEVPLSARTKLASMSTSSYSNREEYLYAVRSDKRVYRQQLSTLNATSPWQLVSKGPVFAIAVSGQNIYGIDPKGRIVMQELEAMSPRTDWRLLKGQAPSVRAVPLQGVAVHGDTVFGVSTANQFLKQTLAWTDRRTRWNVASDKRVSSMCIARGAVFAVDQRSGAVMRQSLEYMNQQTEWKQLTGGKVISVAVHHDTIYAVDASTHAIVTMKLSEASSTESWRLVSAISPDVDAIAVSTGVIHL